MSAHPYVSEWRESRLPEWRETDMAERVTLEAPELRPCNQVAAVPTSTGLLIGCNYRRPMPQPSADAERIQSVFLAKDRPARQRFHLKWKLWLTLLAAVLVFVLTAGCSEPTEIEAERATAAALQDAIAQAQAERPELWAPETIERAKTAALIAAASRK